MTRDRTAARRPTDRAASRPRRVARAAAALGIAAALGVSGCGGGGGGGGGAKTTPPASTIGTTWTPVADHPLVTKGAPLSWRAAGAGDPALLINADGSITLWFTTVGIASDGAGGFIANGPWIGRATGTLGTTPMMTCDPEAAVIGVGASGTWDRYVETASVLPDPSGSGLLMWYLGYAATGGPSGFVAPAIGQMHSTDSDGRGWSRPAAPIYRATAGAWDGTLVTGPSVLRGPDGTWRLYYVGLGTKDGVGLLTSTDLVTWTPYAGNPVFESATGAWDDAIVEPSVIYSHGLYRMWYSGYRNPLSATTSIAIGLATSTDGIHWQRSAANPVLSPGAAGTWDDLRVLAPDVRELSDGTLLMAAYGKSTADPASASGSIGLWRSTDAPATPLSTGWFGLAPIGARP